MPDLLDKRAATVGRPSKEEMDRLLKPALAEYSSLRAGAPLTEEQEDEFLAGWQRAFEGDTWTSQWKDQLMEELERLIADTFPSVA